MDDLVLQGDVKELSGHLEDGSVRTVVCSPPYAMQRKDTYGGILESNYPDWTVEWMKSLRQKLSHDGSIFIVIRPHLKNGQISDYVLKTRLAIRKDGWKECEEIIWFKPDAPPLGSINRPRRTWESILWFSMNSNPYVDLKACGNSESNRTGGFAGSDRFGDGGVSPIHGGQNRGELKKGTSRCSDVVNVTISTMDRGIDHPAMFPQGIPDFLIQTFSEEGDLIVDPFAGSGQTGLSALRLKRRFIGFEIQEKYCELANSRIKQLKTTGQCLPDGNT